MRGLFKSIRLERYVVLLLALAIIGCNPEDKGFATWYSYDGYHELGVDIFQFSKDSIRVIDAHGFMQSGTYEMKSENEMNFALLNNPVHGRFDFKQLNVDSFTIRDSIVFYKSNGTSKDQIDEYELMGMKSDQFLDRQKALRSLHYYRSHDGSPKLRYGHSARLDFQEIPLLLEVRHAKRVSRPVIFLGKTITPLELGNLYRHFAFVYPKVWIVTHKDGLNKYHIYDHNIDFWIEDFYPSLIENDRPPPPPPPPIDETFNRDSFLKDGAGQILINSVKDSIFLNGLDKRNKYLITIKRNISMQDYIVLKQQISDLKNRNVRTEIE